MTTPTTLAAVAQIRHALERGELDDDTLLELLTDETLRFTYGEAVAETELHLRKHGKDGTIGTYRRHWQRQSEAWGGRSIRQIGPDDIRADCETAQAQALIDPRSTNGKAAYNNSLNAAAAVFSRLEPITSHNPTRDVRRLRQHQLHRQALTAEVLDHISTGAAQLGDPLAPLMVDLLLETGARRLGLVNLRGASFDLNRGVVLLDEKFGDKRWVPLSHELTGRILDHASALAGVDLTAEPDAPALYRKSGKPIDKGDAYEIASKIRLLLPASLARGQGWVFHEFRYTLLKAVLDLTGSQVAAEDYAGHKPKKVIGIYTRLTDGEKMWIHDSLFPEFPAATGSNPPVMPGVLVSKLRFAYDVARAVDEGQGAGGLALGSGQLDLIA